MGFFHKLICGALAVLTSICASAESRHCGYWLHGKTMKDVDVPALVSLGTTDIILHEYAFTAHGQKGVEEWIVRADAAGLKVHIWMQVFYNGKWINPVKDGVPDKKLFDEKIARAQSYARMRGVAGVHFDYVRYPGTAYKTPGGAEAVSEFVRLAATQLHQTSPRFVVSAAALLRAGHRRPHPISGRHRSHDLQGKLQEDDILDRGDDPMVREELERREGLGGAAGIQIGRGHVQVAPA